MVTGGLELTDPLLLWSLVLPVVLELVDMVTRERGLAWRVASNREEP